MKDFRSQNPLLVDITEVSEPTAHSSSFVVVLFGCLFSQVEEVKKMKIGDPLDRSTDHGPQNHKAHLDKLVEYCQTGIKEGATLVCGGKQVQRPGKAM